MNEFVNELEAVSANIRPYFENIRGVKPVNPAMEEIIRTIMLSRKSMEDRQIATDTSFIEALIMKCPPLRECIDTDTTFVPNVSWSEVALYESKLIRDDPDNVTAFEDLKDAVLNQKRVRIHFPDPREKDIIGVKLSYINALGERNVVGMSMDELKNHIAWETLGMIGSSPDFGVIAHLEIFMPSQKNIAKAQAGLKVDHKLLYARVDLKLLNVKDVLKNRYKFEQFVEYVFEQHKDVKPVKKAVESEKSFKIKAGKLAKVIRFPGCVDICGFVPKDQPGFEHMAGRL
jgi:hypothetical protein